MNCTCPAFDTTDVCPSCQADIDLLQRLEEPPTTLPSADFLWWKAQIHARREAAEKSARPIVIAERAGLIAAAAAVAITLAALQPMWAAVIGAMLLIPAIPVALWARHHQHSK